MSKQLLFYITLISFFSLNLFFINSSNIAYATAKSCPKPIAVTNPDPLLNDTSDATFIIDLGSEQNRDDPTIQGWKMEFICGNLQLQKDAAKVDETKISTRLSGTDTMFWRCIFSLGNHPNGIKVKQVVANKGDADYCFASYTVTNSAQQCELSLDPKNDITSATNLSISGKNLTSGGRFVVFFDENTTKGITDYVETPNFKDYKIPISFMSPGQHSISLRTRINNNTWPNAASAFSNPLCKVAFTIGTPSQPGAIIPSSSNSQGCQGEDCTRAAGISCDPKDGTKGGTGGILTAIGCIPTEPTALVQGIIKVAIGAGGGIALLLMIYGAFQMITSAGNPDGVKKGHEQITSAVIGLLFIIFAVMLLKVIGVDILQIPGFSP